jgi:hypothetical protein
MSLGRGTTRAQSDLGVDVTGAWPAPASPAAAASAPIGASRRTSTTSSANAVGAATASASRTRVGPRRSTQRPHSGAAAPSTTMYAALTTPAPAYDPLRSATSSTNASGAVARPCSTAVMTSGGTLGAARTAT